MARASPPQPPLQSDAECSKAPDFRAAVSSLYVRCSAEAEAAATAAARRVINCAHKDIAKGRDPPAAVAWPPTCGPSGVLFFARASVRSAARKKKSSKSAAKLPASAYRALAENSSGLAALHAYFNVVWAVAWWSEYILSVELAHLFKGGGRSANSIVSYRAIGICHPLLSIGCDLLLLRTRPFLVGYTGPSQLGGRRDGRVAFVCRLDARARRRSLGLPTVDAIVDARFGYDGGRHCHMLIGISQAGVRPRDMILHKGLLSMCSMQIRDSKPHGVVALLPPIRRRGGGTVQGLAVSGECYSTLPLRCEIAVLCEVPPPCTHVEPRVLAAFRATYRGDLSDMGALWPEDVQVRADEIGALLAKSDKGAAKSFGDNPSVD